MKRRLLISLAAGLLVSLLSLPSLGASESRHKKRTEFRYLDPQLGVEVRLQDPWPAPICDEYCLGCHLPSQLQCW